MMHGCTYIAIREGGVEAVVARARLDVARGALGDLLPAAARQGCDLFPSDDCRYRITASSGR